jgi:transposase
VPRQWKVIQTVREKFTCRSCEKIAQPPAPFHVIARARAGASLLAMILYAKFGEHQPLNRQSESFTREGIELDVSTLADWVGACTASLAPLIELIRRHVLAAERLHGDDTTVPILAKDKTVIGRLWTYVRDDRPFAGPDPPAAVFSYSRNRGGEHPNRHLAGYAGILQACRQRSPKPATPKPGSGHGRCPRIRSRSPLPAAVPQCHRQPARQAPEQSHSLPRANPAANGRSNSPSRRPDAPPHAPLHRVQTPPRQSPASARCSTGDAARDQPIPRRLPSHRLLHQCKHRCLHWYLPARSAHRSQDGPRRRVTEIRRSDRWEKRTSRIIK